MRHLDAGSAITGGGWDPRFAVVVALAESGDVAAALVDTNGDGADVDLDVYARDASGVWQELGSSNVAEAGCFRSEVMSATWGRGRPGATLGVEHDGGPTPVVVSERGWWLVVSRLPAATERRGR